MSANSVRLVRLLNLLPYLKAHPGIGFDAAAADLGVTRKQLADDLAQLTFCGLPGGAGGDLIDIQYDDDGLSIDLIDAQGMDRPLQLTSGEATTLLLALSALVDVPGLVDPAATRSALAKIESATATAGGAPVPEPPADESPAIAAVRAAVHDHRALRIDYFSASRDVFGSRIVDPIRVLLIDSHSYLEAWSRDADGVRLFRFDRIRDASMLDEPSAPPPSAVVAPTDTTLFDADPSLPAATLRIAPAAAWMLEYYPIRLLATNPDGSLDAAMTYAAEEWMTRLLLGFGAAVQVLEPASLAQRVRDAAGDALAAYSVT